MAERIARTRPRVDVVTTCARSRTSTGPTPTPGDRRSSVVSPSTASRSASTRDNRSFNELTDQLIASPGLARRWSCKRSGCGGRVRGRPTSRGGSGATRGEFDCVICFTYLYWTTWRPATCAAGSDRVAPDGARRTAAAVLALRPAVPRAGRVRAVDARRDRSHPQPVPRRSAPAPSSASVSRSAGDRKRFRDVPGARRRPYLLYVGRMDEGKGAVELYRNFVEYKQSNPSRLQLVYLGDAIHDAARSSRRTRDRLRR